MRLSAPATAFLIALSSTECVPLQPLPAPPPAPVPPPSPVAQMPALPVQTVIRDSPQAADSRSPRITLTSSKADLRELLPLLANAAGVDLVVGPEVRGRVSVRFENVPAIDALFAVIEQAGLTVGPVGPDLPWMKPIFYDLPVNINLAGAIAIKARFDITQSLAEWIVRGRTF